MSEDMIQFYLDRIKAMELRIKELESERKELIDFQCLLDDENHNLKEQNKMLEDAECYNHHQNHLIKEENERLIRNQKSNE